ncbi:hypothetical protein SAMN04488500_11020 [Sporomusa malonica]|uniref:Uncharacterized protein n=1 Tax=Sporomusa malonica TaxID=112901 RepID=A0A1W2CB94_9FIRM|nr:hypothetical protein SAMN04488500_11020 [Sporomusa malonica]
MCLATKNFICLGLAPVPQVAYNPGKKYMLIGGAWFAMEPYIADIGIFFAGTLIVLYMLWDRLFPED